MKRELALAILLWKQVRMTNRIPRKPGTSHWITDRTLDIAFLSTAMAKEAGVVEEYMTVLDELPVLNIQVKQLEPWDDPVPKKGLFNPFINNHKPKEK